MSLRHDDAPVPAIARHQHEIREQLLRAGVDRKVDAVAHGHVRNLLGRSLVQMQLDVRIALLKDPDHGRQYVARLGMGRTDRERAPFVAFLLVSEALDALHLPENPERTVDDALPRRRDASEGAPLPQKDRKAELVLELLQLLAHSRLRRVQPFGGSGDVQIVFDDRSEVA